MEPQSRPTAQSRLTIPDEHFPPIPPTRSPQNTFSYRTTLGNEYEQINSTHEKELRRSPPHRCAIVYSGDITVTSTANLQGPTLGRIAFSIVSLVPADDPSHPQAQVQIADWSQSCGGELVPFADAP